MSDQIIYFYAKGITVRDIQDQLREIYDMEVSHDFICRVTDAVHEEVKEWQARPLNAIYPVVYLDGIVVKVKEDNHVATNKTVFLALGINLEGKKELLGMWIANNEGAKFWLNVLTELHNRGLTQVCIFCVDGLKGFPDAIATVYPEARIQLCIVHKIRQSLKFVSWKERKPLVADLKAIYGSATLAEAEIALDNLSAKWDKQFPMISRSWRKDWHNLTAFFDYPPEIRKAIYTTNAIESLNSSLRKVINNKKVFPSDSSVFKILFLAIRHISKRWSMPIKNWSLALNRFSIEFHLDLDS